MYKVITRLTTIDIATTQTLWDNLQNVGVFLQQLMAVLIKSTVSLTKTTHRSQGAIVNNPIDIIFEAYFVVPCYNFTAYMKRQHNNYPDWKLTGTHAALMATAKAKMD